MEDLLQSQIHQSLKLALPEGLKDLMSDISREVLRAQPADLYKFITEYLSALLVTRENLTVASRVCSDVYKCGCQPELEDELRDLGLEDADLENAQEVIVEHLRSGKVKEIGIIRKLLKKEIDEDLLPAILEATRKAFIKHQAHNTTIYQSSSDSDGDEIKCAVKHTLKLFRKTKPSEEEYDMMATKIQASYRAHEIRRCCELKSDDSLEKLNKTTNKNVQLMLPKKGDSSMSLEKEHHEDLPKTKVVTVSSTSLAGSYLNLPKYRPYCAHDYHGITDLEELPEKEHAHIDYTSDKPHLSIVCSDTITNKQKKISFQRNVEKLTFKTDESNSLEEESMDGESNTDVDTEVRKEIDDASVSTDLETADTENEEDSARRVDDEMDIIEDIKETFTVDGENAYEAPEIEEDIKELLVIEDGIKELVNTP